MEAVPMTKVKRMAPGEASPCATTVPNNGRKVILQMKIYGVFEAVGAVSSRVSGVILSITALSSGVAILFLQTLSGLKLQFRR
jgi:hypothetical protein